MRKLPQDFEWYNHHMDPAKMNAMLANARPNELPVLLRGVDLYLRCGSMAENEASEWRCRIGAWAAFRGDDDGSLE